MFFDPRFDLVHLIPDPNNDNEAVFNYFGSNPEVINAIDMGQVGIRSFATGPQKAGGSKKGLLRVIDWSLTDVDNRDFGELALDIKVIDDSLAADCVVAADNHPMCPTKVKTVECNPITDPEGDTTGDDAGDDAGDSDSDGSDADATATDADADSDGSDADATATGTASAKDIDNDVIQGGGRPLNGCHLGSSLVTYNGMVLVLFGIALALPSLLRRRKK